MAINKGDKRICPSDWSYYSDLLAVSKCDFYVKIAEISRISYVKIADQNLGDLTLEMARIGMDWSRRDETERTLSAWRRFAPTVPVWGLFLMVFFHSDSSFLFPGNPFHSFSLLRSFPFWLFLSVCVSSQRSPTATAALSVAIQDHLQRKNCGA